MRNLTKLFAIFFMVASTGPLSAETWHRADTDNFIIFSTGKSDDLRDRAIKLERFDALMRMRYRIPATPSPNRLIVYLLDDERDVMQALACRNRGGVAGFYSDRLEGSYFVSHRRRQSDKNALQPQEVLFHEYGHHFMFRYFPFAYPGWYREGFAEYYATTEFDEDGNWNYGKPPRYRGSSLIGGRQIPVAKMLTKAQSDLSPEESYQVYTRGWLLTHMLHSDPDKNRQLSQYLAEIARGESREIAAKNAFGDFGRLERELRKYMGESPTYIRGREPITYSGKLSVVTLDDIGSDLEQLRLSNSRSCDRKEIVSKLESLAEKATERVDVKIELADAYHSLAHENERDAEVEANEDLPEDAEKVDIAPDMTRALAIVDEALALEPENARANALKAEFLLDIAQHSDEPGYWGQARNHAIKANQANPDNPFPLKLYYDSYVEAGNEVPDEARAALSRAFELAPEVNSLRIQFALDLAMQGEFDRAISTVEFLLGSPHASKQGKLAMRQIDAIRAGEDYATVSDWEAEDDEEDDDADLR